MAQFVHQYVTELLRRQTAVMAQMGASLYGVHREAYLINLTLLTAVGVVMKKISDVAPAVTDQVWIDALGQALDGAWPPDILAQIDPNKPVDPGATPPGD